MRAVGILPRAPTAPRAGVLQDTLRRWEWLAALLLAAAVFTTVQLASPSIIEEDSFYHIKMAALMREQGPRLTFPWLRFTLLNEAGYSDHHFLFHLLQAPFTVLDLTLAAKLSAVVFATLGAFGCYLFLARSGVGWPLGWLALLLAVAHTFLWRQSMARAQSLSLLLLVAALGLLQARRSGWLVPLGFAAAWLFDGALLVLAVPTAWLAARLLLERRFDWRPLAALALGILLGEVLHPYFPRNVLLVTEHLLPKLGLLPQEQVPVGQEWYRLSPLGFLSLVGPSLGVLVVGLAPLLWRLWRRERPDTLALALALLGLGFLALLVRMQRIIEYFPAFAVLLAARSWSTDGRPLLSVLSGLSPSWRRALTGLGALLLASWLVWTVSLARRDVVAYAPISTRSDSYRDAAAWLVANSPPGSLVFNTDWDDFPQLFFYDTHNVYVVGLDPTRMSLYDPELYRLWKSISGGALPDPATALREQFGAQYVLTDTLHTRFLAVAATDPGLEEVFRSPAAVVFRVR